MGRQRGLPGSGARGSGTKRAAAGTCGDGPGRTGEGARRGWGEGDAGCPHPAPRLPLWPSFPSSPPTLPLPAAFGTRVWKRHPEPAGWQLCVCAPAASDAASAGTSARQERPGGPSKCRPAGGAGALAPLGVSGARLHPARKGRKEDPDGSWFPARLSGGSAGPLRLVLTRRTGTVLSHLSPTTAGGASQSAFQSPRLEEASGRQGEFASRRAGFAKLSHY